MSVIDNLRAVNAAFGYSFPQEIAKPIEKDLEPRSLNNCKVLMYLPVLRTVLCGNLMKEYRDSYSKRMDIQPIQKAFFARAVIAESLGLLSSVVLVITDIFFTILVKPFLNLAVFILNKKGGGPEGGPEGTGSEIKAKVEESVKKAQKVTEESLASLTLIKNLHQDVHSV